MARFFLLCLAAVDAFTLNSAPHAPVVIARHSAALMAERPPFSLSLDLPPRGKCALKFKPLKEESEAIVVKYDIPFGLSVENVGGLATVTKDGAGGEKVGDLLRYCTKFELALPEGGSVIGTLGSFSGLLKWQLGLLDVAKADSWDEVSTRATWPCARAIAAPRVTRAPAVVPQVVEALTSNTAERTDTVTLVFERPL